MHFTSALVAGTLALQASAFLLPLEVTEAAESAKAEVESLFSKRPHIFELDCPGCPFAGLDKAEPQWEEDVDNRIRLAFNVDAEQRLTINDQIVFLGLQTPPTDGPRPIEAPQVRVSDDKQTAPIPIGWSLVVPRPISNPSEPNKELFTLEFTTLDLKGIPVEVDTLKIDLLRVTSGEIATLSILNISPVPFEDTPGADCPSDSRWSLCRIRAIIMARMRDMLEAAKSRTNAAKSWMKKPKGCKGKGKGKFGKHGRPGGPFHGMGPGHHGPHGHGMGEGHHGPHGGPHAHHGPHHGHHHGSHRLAHMLHQALRFFVIPALLGVIGGLVASVIGILVGRFIVYIWIRFHRNGQRGNVRVIEIAVHEDEKNALIDDHEGSPPLYTDVEAVVVEEHHSE